MFLTERLSPADVEFIDKIRANVVKIFPQFFVQLPRKALSFPHYCFFYLLFVYRFSRTEYFFNSFTTKEQ